MAEGATDALHSIFVELVGFDRAEDWFTRALHLNAALLYAIGQHLTADIRERLMDAEKRLLAESPLGTPPT